MSFQFKSGFCVAALSIMFLWKIEEASGIVCYDCNSEYDPRCGEDFNPYSLGVVNCSLRDPPEGFEDVEPTICRTIKMEIYGKKRYVRSCGYLRDSHVDGKCARRPGTHDLFTHYCSCSRDLCNAADSRTPRALLAAIAATTAAALRSLCQ